MVDEPTIPVVTDVHAADRAVLLAAGLGTAALTSGTAAAGWAGYRLLLRQAAVARGIIGRTWEKPPEADGIYLPGADRPVRYGAGVGYDTHLMIFGDSTAAGMGCVRAQDVPGVRIAQGLSERTGRRVRLSTKAISGATSRGLSGQVDAMHVAGPAPDAAVIMIGANDVTAVNGVLPSARRLGAAVDRLRSSGAVVVVGTCPDLGVVGAIPQPLRSVLHTWGTTLARAQAREVRRAGGRPVSLGRVLAPQFLSDPDGMFAEDRFHPSAAGYALAAAELLPELVTALDTTGANDTEPTTRIVREHDAARPGPDAGTEGPHRT